MCRHLPSFHLEWFVAILALSYPFRNNLTLALSLGPQFQRRRRWNTAASTLTTPTRGLGRTCVIAYHKPANVVTTSAVNDVQGRCNVFQDLMARPAQGQPLPLDFPNGWHSVGRLDAETTGLLLLTNDGGLVHRVTNKNAVTDRSTTDASAPHTPVRKTYEACIMGHHENDCDVLQTLRSQGVDIGAKHGGHTLPVPHIHVLSHPSAKSTLVSLTLVEGKNRQVRRMFHALGSGVMKLKRTAMGVGSTSLSVTALVPNEGDWCVLTDNQVATALNYTPRQLSSTGIATSQSSRHGPTPKRKR